jgi:tetratricopeptide (TPR) repeat protein
MQLFSALVIGGFLLTASSCTTIIMRQAAPVKDPAQPSYVSQGNQFAKDGLLREAVECYKKALVSDPQNFTAHRNLGIVLLKAGDAPAAIVNIEKSLAEYDDNFEANYYLAEAYRSEEKFAEAIFRYKKSLKIQPDEPRAMKSLAWSYFKIRFYSEAILMAQALQKHSPDDEQAPLIVARTLLKLKRDKEASATLTKVIDRVTPQSQPYYQSVMAEVLVAQGKTTEALEIFQKAIKSQPMLAGALMSAGQLLLSLDRKKEATDYLERAVRIKPKMYDAHYWLGRCLEESNPERAMRYFAFFRKNAANDPEFVELVHDSRVRTASLTGRIKMENP